MPSCLTITFGPYTKNGGSPNFVGMKGWAKPSHPVTDLATGDVISRATPFYIGADGSGSVDVLHNDQSGISPTGFTYKITWESGYKAHPAEREVATPLASGSTIDYDTMVPSTSNPQVVVAYDGLDDRVTTAEEDILALEQGKADNNDPRFSDARPPTPHSHGQYALANDPRFSDARQPLPHSHPEYVNPDLTGYVVDDDPRLSDARPPTAHTHGQYVEDDDPRLTDARTPTAHEHAQYLTAEDLPEPPDLSAFLTEADLPPAPDLSPYATTEQLDSVGTSTADGGELVRRDEFGIAAFANVDIANAPTAAWHGTRMDWVQGQVADAIKVVVSDDLADLPEGGLLIQTGLGDGTGFTLWFDDGVTA